MRKWLNIYERLVAKKRSIPVTCSTIGGCAIAIEMNGAAIREGNAAFGVTINPQLMDFYAMWVDDRGSCIMGKFESMLYETFDEFMLS